MDPELPAAHPRPIQIWELPPGLKTVGLRYGLHLFVFFFPFYPMFRCVVSPVCLLFTNSPPPFFPNFSFFFLTFSLFSTLSSFFFLASFSLSREWRNSASFPSLLYATTGTTVLNCECYLFKQTDRQTNKQTNKTPGGGHSNTSAVHMRDQRNTKKGLFF